MVVASLESKFSVFDLRTQHPTKGFASLTEKVITPSLWCRFSAFSAKIHQCIYRAVVVDLCRYQRHPLFGVCDIFHRIETYLCYQEEEGHSASGSSMQNSKICNCKNLLSFSVIFSFFSSYPDRREKEDDKGVKMGVVGSVSLLQNITIASQPISSMDWSPDKVQEGVVVTLSYIM